MIRESPTRQSIGQTTVRAVEGGYMISSFFDVFIEISLDGGLTWNGSQASGRVELHGDPALVPGVAQSTPLLPPAQGAYLSQAQFRQSYGPQIVIKDVRTGLFSDS